MRARDKSVMWIVSAACVAALWLVACDGTMSPIEDADGGDLDSPSGLYGVCAIDPTSCDEIIDEDGYLLQDCCRGGTRYWCQNGELFHTECTAGCSYDAGTDSISCLQDPGTWGTSDGPGGGGGPGLQTDPGPGF